MDDNSISKLGAVANIQSYKSIMPVQKQSPEKSKNLNTTQEIKSQNSTKTVVGSDIISTQFPETLRNLDTLRAIEQMHANLNKLVKSVRETNEAVNNASEKVIKIKGSIDTIIKTYPPLSSESKERRDMLMEYVSLRKELLSLEVPKPPQPVYEKIGLMWDSLFNADAQLQNSAVPDIGANSSDAQLKEASATLDNTSGQLADLSTTITKALVAT
jgi:hypothetical protein